MQLPFEETYLLNLVERPDKYEMMRKRIDYMGWDVKDFRVVSHPVSDLLVNTFNQYRFDENLIGVYSGSEFNCAREQYTIIKSAYLRGVETVAIMEDDISFYKDMSVWDEHFDNLPEDWDVLRINSLRGNEECGLFADSDKFWEKQKDIELYGAGFYAMNRNAMKFIIDCVDEKYQPIDNILSFRIDEGIKMYIPNIPLSLCLDDSFNSDIRGIIDERFMGNSLHFNYKKIPTFKREDYI